MANLPYIAFTLLLALGVSWGAILYAIERQFVRFQPLEVSAWLVGAPIVLWSLFLLLRSGVKALRAKRKERAEQARAHEAERQREVAEAQARQEDRRFDGVVAVQSELVLPNPAYGEDFAGALQDGISSMAPTEIAYAGDTCTITARRVEQLVAAELPEVYHPRSQRVAALCARTLQRFSDGSAKALDALAETVAAFDAQHPLRTEPLHYWEKSDQHTPPSLTVRLLHQSALTDDARILRQHLEDCLAGLALPARLAVTTETRQANAVETLNQIEEIIEAVRQEPMRAWLLIAADSHFDEDYFRSVLDETRSADPVVWQQRTHRIPSEGGCGVFLASRELADLFNPSPIGCLKRPIVLDDERPGISCHMPLHEALVRGAADFDTAPLPTETVWLDADRPDKRLSQSCQELHALPRQAAVAAYRLPSPEEHAPQGEPVAEPPEIQSVRRVFGELGAVNALGLVSAALQSASPCDLVVAADEASAIALAVTAAPVPAGEPTASAPA